MHVRITTSKRTGLVEVDYLNEQPDTPFDPCQLITTWQWQRRNSLKVGNVESVQFEFIP